MTPDSLDELRLYLTREVRPSASRVCWSVIEKSLSELAAPGASLEHIGRRIVAAVDLFVNQGLAARIERYLADHHTK